MANKKPKKQPVKFVYNILIVMLTIVVLGFIFSFAQKSWKKGVTIQNPQLSDGQKEQLALDIYEANPILDIKVEVLNGCGETGIAAKIADYLRTEQIDAIRWENADNFDYEETLLVHRSDDLVKLKAIAKAINFDIGDKSRVKIQFESDSDVDFSIILGKDYRSIKPIKLYLANL